MRVWSLLVLSAAINCLSGCHWVYRYVTNQEQAQASGTDASVVDTTSFSDCTGKCPLGSSCVNGKCRCPNSGTCTGVLVAANTQIDGQTLNLPHELLIDENDDLYVSDLLNARVLVLHINSGTFSYVKNYFGPFEQPTSLQKSSSAELYVSDAQSDFIFKIELGKEIINFFAGQVGGGFADGNKSTIAKFKTPRGLALERTANILYVADSDNNALRKIQGDEVSTINPVTGSCACAPLSNPRGLALDSKNNLYVTNWVSHVISKLDQAGNCQQIIGQCNVADTGYQTGAVPIAQAKFNTPRGIAIDSADQIYVTNFETGRINMIANGTVTTLAPSVSFNKPVGIALDRYGVIYVSESGANQIQMIVLP